MPKPVTPYQEKNGKTWSFRIQRNGRRTYHSGFTSKTAAWEALAAMATDSARSDKPAGMGPHQTSVAVALSDYAKECLPFRKGARQEAGRINRFLRAAGLPILKLTPTTSAAPTLKAAMRGDTKQTAFFQVALVNETTRPIPNSLRKHRAQLESESANSALHRKRLANTMVADVGSVQIQDFVGAMRKDDHSASTIHLEVAIVRQLFTYARTTWKWPRPLENPASSLDLPKLDNQREQVLTEEDWEKIAGPLTDYGNPYVLPLACMMLETAMRSCEPLTIMRWRDIDRESRILRLPDGKSGKRSVPLGPGALLILQRMQIQLGRPDPNEKVFPITYEAFKKAWNMACKAANIKGIKPHDLRHTSATRYSLEFKGDIPVLKLITGHKTSAMVEHYVNLNAKQVATLMHGEELPKNQAPAGFLSDVAAVALALIEHEDWLKPKKRRAAKAKNSSPNLATIDEQIQATPATSLPHTLTTEHSPTKLPADSDQKTPASTPYLATNVIRVNFPRAA